MDSMKLRNREVYENPFFNCINKCRVCLTQNAMLLSISSKCSNETIVQLISFVAGVEIEENDNLPQFVCNDCLMKLESASEIKRQCLESDQHLRDQITESEVLKSIKKEEIDITDFEDADHYSDNEELDPICEFPSVLVKLEHMKQELIPPERREKKKMGRPKKDHRKRPEPKRKNKKVPNGTVCRSCNKSYIDKYSLYRHSKRCTKHFYACEICRTSIQYKQEFLDHVKKHEENGDPPIMQCETCQEKLYYRDAIDQHKCPIDKKEKFLCYMCNCLEFTEKNDLLNHLRTHKIEGALICPIPECNGKRIIKPHNFYHHMEGHYNPANVCCSICGMFFADRLLHVLHRRKHKLYKNTPVTCDLCGRDISSKQKLLRHMLAQHMNNENLLCDQCSCSFPKANLLRKHQVKEHGAIGDYQCEICGCWYLAQSSLNNHMKRHLQKPVLECEICGQVCRNTTELKIHVELVHVRKTPHQCQYCLKYFKYAWHLSTHILIHTGEKNFECHVCSKRFITKPALDEHMRMHTGETPYQCHIPTCLKRYRSHSGLRRHFKLFHKIETANMKNLFSRNNKQVTARGPPKRRPRMLDIDGSIINEIPYEVPPE